MTTFDHRDEEILRQYSDKLPEYLIVKDAVVYHPFENEEEEQLCRNYVKRLKFTVRLDDGRIPDIVLYDDLFVPDVTKLGKFQHVENFSHYKSIYVTEDFSSSEDLQRFLSETSLIVSIEDSKKRGTVIFVYPDKNLQERMIRHNIYQSLLIPLLDQPEYDQKVISMFNSVSSKQRKKELEQSVKCDQIKWLRDNIL